MPERDTDRSPAFSVETSPAGTLYITHFHHVIVSSVQESDLPSIPFI
jgi:hypothetical protein